MKIVVVGGVAGGMSAAARARRLDENAEIVVLEKGPYVSFANCGLPYHLSGEIEKRESLLLQTPASLRASLNLDVRVNSTVTRVDPAAKAVTVAGPDGTYELGYDALVLSPGGSPMTPPIEGVERDEVHRLYTIPQLDDVMAAFAALPAEPAPEVTVVGAGFIGLEAVEAFAHRGAKVTLVEFAPHVLPPIDAALAGYLEDELVRNGVDVLTSTAVTAIEGEDAGSGLASDELDGGHSALSGVSVKLSDGSAHHADLVLLSTGVVPNTSLARDAGLSLNERGAIVVDGAMRTSDPSIWAVGDAVQVRREIGGVELLTSVPLAAPANRHGRLAADAIIKGTEAGATPPTVLSTAIVRVFGLVAAVTGASRLDLERSGVESFSVHTHPGSHAGYYPGSEQMHMVVSFAPDGTLLGGQAVGPDGVDKRVDVLATAIKGGLTADDLADLDLAYAPPFGSAKDPVNMVAFVAQNVIDGSSPQWYAEDLDEAKDTGLVLDARSPGECANGMVPGALNVPHTQIRERLEEIKEAAAGRPVFVHCASGFRSYLSTRILRQNGVDARNLAGGMLTMKAVRPDWTE